MLQDPALGVAGEEDLVNARAARRRADPTGQVAGLAQEDVVARQAIGIDGQEEDVIAGRARGWLV